MKKKLLLMLVMAIIASGANAAVIFYESFESPVVAGYAQGTSPDNGQWVRANQGYNSSWHGIINNDAAVYATPYGNQCYSFRYSNSGMTTSYGAIGVLEAGVTYTISFSVGADRSVSEIPYSLELMVFNDDTIARNDCRSTPAGAKVLATVSSASSEYSPAPEDGSWATVTYEFTADPVDHADSIGKDIALRFLGASTTANIDYVKVVVGGDQNPSPVDGATLPAGDVVLNWTNNDPNNGNPIYIDVWYGTDPDAMALIVDGVQDANTVTVSAPAADTYYWRVDTHTDGNPDGPAVVDLTYKFYVIDTDGDGMPDEYELLYTDPASGTALDPNDDIDNDGLITWDEFATTNTFPNDADSDDDGLLDGPELLGVDDRPATDPLKADTDGDGLIDSVETNTGVFVDATDTGTNPVDLDWDKDGLKDGVETNTGVFVDATDTGTNPYNSDSDSDGSGDWYEAAAAFTSPVDSAEFSIPYPLPDPDPCDVPADFKTKPVKVYIMSGQSNMVGFGTVSGTGDGTLETMTMRENKFPNLIDESNAWTTRQDVHFRAVISDIADAKLSPGALGGTFGPELGFGYIMGWYHDEPVLLLKSCTGNRGLGWDILPPGSPSYEYGGEIYAGYGEGPAQRAIGEDPDPAATWWAGREYDRFFMDESEWGVPQDPAINVVDVLDNFATQYPEYASQGFEIAGFVWWQGDKDRYKMGYATKYEENLVNLINSLRSYYTNRYPGQVVPNAPFVLATLGQTVLGDSSNPAEEAILNAQLAVDGEAGKYPAFAGNVKTVYSHPLSAGGASNGHYNKHAATYMLVGDALGRAMMELQSGFSVDAGDDMITWSGESIVMAPNVEEGVTVQSYIWTATSSDPENTTIDISDANVEAPTITITKNAGDAVTVTVTLTVDDGENPPVSNSFTIDVYDDACKATIATGAGAANPTDLNGDCVTNLADFAELAARWLDGEIMGAPQHKVE